MKYKKLCSSVALSLVIAVSVSVQTASAVGGLGGAGSIIGRFAADTKTATPTAKSADTAAANPVAGGAGVQSYAADAPLQNGTIVQLKDSAKGTVSVSTKGDLGHMYGVTVDRQKLSISISNSNLKNEAYVATAGTHDVLVSTQNGPIAAGDYVTLSAINGVAMKAGPDNKTVFGRAAIKFDGRSDTIGKVSLKDTAGKQDQTVAIGMVAVSIDVKANPDQKSTKTNVPDFLQRIGEAIAEKPVGAIRMYLSIAITAITIVAAAVILYSGVRNSIISIGRNPLSKKSVFRALLEIIFTSILIMIIGLFAVYLLLKL